MRQKKEKIDAEKIIETIHRKRIELDPEKAKEELREMQMELLKKIRRAINDNRRENS